MAFLPPALIALLYPAIFLKALDVAGGIGIVTLFGILPCMIAVCKKSCPVFLRLAGIIFLLFALAALITALINLGGGKPDLSPECREDHGNIKFTIKKEINL